MRKGIDMQMEFWKTDVASIEFNLSENQTNILL